MNLKENKRVILNKDLFSALRSIYTPKKEIFFFLLGEIKEDKIVIHDAKYVLQESSFDSVYFKDLPSGFIGTFHTHPLNCKPSEQDLKIFNKLGGVHVIMGKNCIAAYNLFGNELELVIVSDEKEKKSDDPKEMKFHYVFIYTIILCVIILIVLLLLFIIVWFFT